MGATSAEHRKRQPNVPRIGLALGSGSSRGWAHIGIIRALQERGIEPDVIAGASIGSLVGAAFASGQLDALESWAVELRRRDVWRLLDAALGRGGVMSGERLMTAVGEQLDDHAIEELPTPFAAVATELDTGVEVWLREGSMLDAVRCSSGIPGLFTPVWHGGRWLIDGGVVNPVPVSLCRALGADHVIAVNLNKHLKAYATDWTPPEPEEEPPEAPSDSGEEDQDRLERWQEKLTGLVESWRAARRPEPGVFDVIGTSISIMQDRITRSRMVGDPPEIILEPDLGTFELMDFHRAAEAIDLGREVVEEADRQVEQLKALVER